MPRRPPRRGLFSSPGVIRGSGLITNDLVWHISPHSTLNTILNFLYQSYQRSNNSQPDEVAEAGVLVAPFENTFEDNPV